MVIPQQQNLRKERKECAALLCVHSLPWNNPLRRLLIGLALFYLCNEWRGGRDKLSLWLNNLSSSPASWSQVQSRTWASIRCLKRPTHSVLVETKSNNHWETLASPCSAQTLWDLDLGEGVHRKTSWHNSQKVAHTNQVFDWSSWSSGEGLPLTSFQSIKDH